MMGLDYAGQWDWHYEIVHRWRATYDGKLASGRKRAADGIGSLDTTKAKKKWDGCNSLNIASPSDLLAMDVDS